MPAPGNRVGVRNESGPTHPTASSDHRTCKTTFFRVEPRGFEPLTSAVQMLTRGFTVVSRCQEIRINKRIPRVPSLQSSPDVNSGHCQVTVSSLCALVWTQTTRTSPALLAHFDCQSADGTRRVRAPSATMPRSWGVGA